MATFARMLMLIHVSLVAFALVRAVPPPTKGMYSLMSCDILIHISADGTNTTIGRVDLGQHFNPVGTQLSTIVEKTATMYVLALNKTDNVETALVGISLADASITGVYPTPLLQASAEIGLGMTIDAYGKHGLVISGVDRATNKHTAYTVDIARGHAVQKLSDGFLAGAEGMLDPAHCFDAQSSTFWLMSPGKNYSASGLFDLVGIDLTTGSEVARHTQSAVWMVHAMEHDPHTGGLVALGLDATTFKPFVFTIEATTFKPTIVAEFDAYSIFNSISAWDPLRRTIFGMGYASHTDLDPVLLSYSLADKTKASRDLCQGGDIPPFNIDWFPGRALTKNGVATASGHLDAAMEGDRGDRGGRSAMNRR